MWVHLERARRGAQARHRAGTGIAGWFVVGSLLVATALASGAAHWWVADLAVHFRPQYVAVALVATAVFALLRRPLPCVLAALALCVNALPLLPAYTSTAHASAAAKLPADARAFRIASVNVLYRNDDYERVAAWLESESPDVAVLVEVTDTWRERLEPRLAAWPWRVHAPGLGAHGVWMISKWPLLDAEIVQLAVGTSPDVTARVHTPRGDFRIFGVHATWPAGERNSADRRRELRGLAMRTASAGTPVLAVGDLNVTSYSPHFRDLLDDGRLTDAAAGHCAGHTWPTFMPLAGIRIDHLLTSRGVRVLGCRHGPDVGSDHLPIVLDVLPGDA